MRRITLVLAIVALALGVGAMPQKLISHTALSPDFVHFESSHVHPVAMTPDGTRLLVVNTPDNRLSVFDVTGAVPVRIAEIPVGLEPVSVAARTNGEAWVVNNLSDDVSIVDLSIRHTVATLRVGDEPSDVVFAGASNKAYISVSQEDAVKVYDPTNLAAAPVVIPIPGRMPRALARSFDGSQVVVDVFHSSAQSTTLSAAEAGDSLPPPDPPQSPALPPAPKTGLELKRTGGAGPNSGWLDQAGHRWDSKIPYQVPLNEVVRLSTVSNTVHSVRGDIATIMLGAAPSPLDTAIAVTGMYSILEARLEQKLRGHFTEQRLAVIRGPNAPRVEVQLNPHITALGYQTNPGPQSDADSALGMPTGVCWSPDAQRVYVTSLATNKLGVFSTTNLAANSVPLIARVPTLAGPTGVIADPARPRLYVVGRFHNQIQVLSTANFASLATVAIGFDPTPDEIVNGRKFFYGGFTSGHGEQACASCHLFGDMDNLVWELGNPQGTMAPAPPNQTDPFLQGFHPMKGPMATQSLRGLPNTGLLHWRGDRADLNAFNPAFVSLMGRGTQLPDSEMVAFSNFVFPLVYPPNPNQNLDRSMPDAPPGQPSAMRGQNFFMNTPVDGGLKCVDCHALPAGTNGQVIDHTALQESQDIKVPQLRNLYKKSGFKDSIGVVNKRGFGYLHDGSIDNLFNFLKFPGFNFGTPQSVADANRRDMERFLLAFDTGMAPAVGHQITFNGANNADPTLNATLDTLLLQADIGNCELVAHGRLGTTPRGWKYEGADVWHADVSAEVPISRAELTALASAGHEVTITGVPIGSATRMGQDRDGDGYPDGDELAAGTDPGDRASHPLTAVGGSGGVVHGLRAVRPNPFRSAATIDYALARAGEVRIAVYDVLGRRTREISPRQRMVAGAHSVSWDGRAENGRPVATGVYFLRLEIDGHTWQRPIVRVR